MKKRAPFPQANNLQMVFEIFVSIGNEGTSKFFVMDQCKIADREARYYLDALAYLGLVQKQKMKYFLTDEGATLKMSPPELLEIAFAIKIVEIPFLRELYEKEQLFINKLNFRKHIASCITQKEQLDVNTAMRRAGTILSWFEWINQYKKQERRHE